MKEIINPPTVEGPPPEPQQKKDYSLYWIIGLTLIGIAVIVLINKYLKDR